MKKYDIINLLGRRYGLRNYIEICTPSTGLTFGLVDGGWFTNKHRLVYNCPDSVDDGLTYTYRTSLLSSHEILKTISTALGGTQPYDLIFVDGWHTLECAQSDLSNAWQLLRDGGFMVIHDCNPEREEFTSPTFRVGEWCGVSYQAYVDFVFGRQDLNYFTVDTDYGCGVICKRTRNAASTDLTEEEEVLRLNWTIVSHDHALRYAFFEANRTRLLNLLSVDEFLSRVGGGLFHEAEPLRTNAGS